MAVGGGCDAESVPEGGDERARIGVAARAGRAGDGAARGQKDGGVLQYGVVFPVGNAVTLAVWAAVAITLAARTFRWE